MRRLIRIPRMSLSLKIVIWTLSMGALYIGVLTWFSYHQVADAVRLSEESALLNEHIRFHQDTERIIDQSTQLARALRSLPKVSAPTRDQLLGRIGEVGVHWSVIKVYRMLNGRPNLVKMAIRGAGGLEERRQRREWEARLEARRIDFTRLEDGQTTVDRLDGADPLIIVARPLTRALDGSIAELGLVILSEKVLTQKLGTDRSKLQAFVRSFDRSPVFSSDQLTGEELDQVFARITEASSSTKQFSVAIRNQPHLVSASEVSDQLWAITALPLSIIEIPVRQAFRWNLLLGLGILSLGIVISVAFTVQLTQPLELLTEVLRMIGRGDFNVEAASRVKTGDEIEYLAESVDRMAVGLKERDKVKTLFQKFHGTVVTEDLMGREISLGGQSKDIVVFFSDIRGFTTMSERMSPEIVVDILNRYFSRMVKVISRNGGVVDKFVGDAIMAVWGISGINESTTQSAYNACLEMRAELERLNQEFVGEGLPQLRIGMGLHRGTAIVGTLGSEDRMEFTSIGDTINIAARVESLTKEYETDLLVTQSVFDALAANDLVSHGEIILKGKAKPVRIFGPKAA